jgi:tetraprenyl-beta-curcumene synthase
MRLRHTVVGETAAVLSALGIYRLAVVPGARRELRRWESVAGAIPDPALRGHALAALREKGLNAEASAVLAALAPRANRAAAIEAIIALQVAVDYLDTLGEQPAPDPLANGLQLHRALSDALSPGEAAGDWYRLHPQGEDGGYLGALVAACRGIVQSLPAQAAALPAAQRAGGRCGEGQSHTHAAALGDIEGLRAWASGLQGTAGYRWWEVAAGASSSVSAHALIAAAADPETTAEEAALIEAAYFPPIGALTVLLDDLIDLEEDRAERAHNYMAYYVGNLDAAERLASIAGRAGAAAGKLRHAARHRAILAGVAGFYLSAPGARTAYARPIRDRMIESLGFAVRPLIATMRLRRDECGRGCATRWSWASRS